MEIVVSGRAVRSLAYTSCIVLSSTWAVAAHAQTFEESEKVLQTTEPVSVLTTQHLGSAVAVAGDRVLSIGGAGNLYVFGRNAQGDWSQTAKLIAPKGGTMTGPIAFDGTNALVRGYTPTQSSVVYYFQYDGAHWRALAVLSGAPNFGRAIAMEGCTALISSAVDEYDPYRSPQPPAFVHFFDRCRAGGWTYVSSFATPGGAGPTFGSSVALSGNNALVGAPAGYGRVYHYVRTGDTWALKETLQENANPQHGNFGKAVAISDNLAIVSGLYSREDGLGSGQIVKFAVNGTTLTPLGRQDFYWPVDVPGFESFGEKVIITPSYVFVSAPGRSNFIPWNDSYTTGGYTDLSWVLAFPRQGATNLGQPARIGSYDRERVAPPELERPLPYYQNARFGSDIAVSGSTLVVGSELFKVRDKPKIEEGRVYAYDIPASTP